MILAGLHFPLRFVRFISLALCFVLVFSIVPISLRYGNQSAQGFGNGGQKRSSPPFYKLPNLNNLMNEGKKLQRPALPQPTPRPSTICGYRDEACKRKKEQEKKVGRNFAPSNDNAVQVVGAAARKRDRNWLSRLGGAFSNALTGFTLVSAKGDSFLASDVNRSAGNSAPAAHNNTAAVAASAMPPTFGSFLEAKLDPRNRVGGSGEDLFSGNYNFSLPIVSLPGRAGLDLNLTISYNSLIWIRWANIMAFDHDYYPSLTPGFRIGFPEIQGPYYHNGVNTYIVYLPSGRRVEMRQVETNKFEAIDSSYLYLDVNAVDLTQMTLYSTDGTQYKFVRPFGGNSDSRCTQIKDSNGNYISILYKNVGDAQYPATLIDKVIDTLGREILFEYDGALHLQKIKQMWNGQEFVWAHFEYDTKLVTPNFGSLYVDGPRNADIPIIKRIVTGDGARHTFNYNSWGQVDHILTYGEADNHRASVVYAFPSTATSQSDCPRFTQRNDGIFAWPGEVYDEETQLGYVSTYFYFDPNETYGEFSGPDAVTHKEFFSTTGGTRGLTTRTETHYGGKIQQFTEIAWASDSLSSPPVRPRVIASQICDDRNHNGVYNSEADKLRRTTIAYDTHGPTAVNLPRVVKEYNEGGLSVYRTTVTSYVDSTNYTGNTRRIIGLPSITKLYEGDLSTLVAQTENIYDSPDESGTTFLQSHSSTPRQHDSANYGTGFQYRGNITKSRRYSVVNGAAGSFTETKTGYYITGTPALAKDAMDHLTTISYDDSFLHYTEPASGMLNETVITPNPPTYAYPTKVTVNDPPKDFSSTISYNYDFGAVTRTVDPKAYAADPQSPQTKAVHTYDSKGRLEKALIWKDGTKYSQMRYVYGNDQNYVQTWTTVNNLNEETAVLHMLDGIGRERITVNEHPGSQGGLSASYRVYDKMGRVSEWSRPTEIDSQSFSPAGDDSYYVAGSQTFDWKGRPKVIFNLDGTFKTINYTGCGCSGSDATELIDEVGRKKRVYRDVFGREEKTESYTWENEVYSTQINVYNVRDQVTQINRMSGSNGTNLITTTQYDGYGRLWKKREPIESGDTTYEHNSDDTIWRITDARQADARQAAATFTYNNRQLVTGIAYTVPAGVAATPNVSYGYDENGNRISMTDGLGSITYSYDSLSRMESETRYFGAQPGTPGQQNPPLPGTYALNYQYNLAGQVKNIGYNPSAFPNENTYVSYSYDKTGRMTSITGPPIGNTSNYCTGMNYTAWGEVKSLTYGDGFIMAATYNNRQQLQSFKEYRPDAGSPIDKSYQYYPDGKIKFSDNNGTQDFDRAFRYDHVGRLEDAWTGVQANNFINNLPIGTDIVPYRLAYQYDTWGNQLSQKGKIWSLDVDETEVYYGLRRGAWAYDGAGNVIHDGETQYQYDAAGRNVTVMSGNSLSTQTYDGDGLVGRRLPNGGIDPMPIFYLRSSVLGGKVIVEINGKYADYGGPIPRGGKWEFFVYHGEKKVANQHTVPLTPVSQYVNFDNLIDPITGTKAGYTILNGHYGYGAITEPDPNGIDVGLFDPGPTPPPPPDIEQPNYFGGEIWNPLHPTFLLDGIKIPVAMAVSAIENRSAVVAPSNQYVTIIRHGQERLARFQAFADGYQGYVPIGAQYIGNGQISYGNGGTPTLYKRAPGAPRDTDLARLNGATGEADLGRRRDFGSFLNLNWQQGGGQQRRLMQDQQGGRLTSDQCGALRELLSREEKHGTVEAARMSSVNDRAEGFDTPLGRISPTSVISDKLLRHFNTTLTPNIRLADGREFDLDWFTTVLQHTVINPQGYLKYSTLGLAQPWILYGGGKWIWNFRRKEFSMSIGNVFPLQDPGERSALLEIYKGSMYKDLFTDEFFKKYCQ